MKSDLSIVKTIFALFLFNALVVSVPSSAAEDEFAIANNIISQVINAEPGTRITLPKGVIKFNKSIALFTSEVTLEGQGREQTVLDFSSVRDAAQGILVRASDVTFQGFSVINSPGDGIVIRGSKNFMIKNVGVTWQPGFSGGYGIYPVQSTNVEVLDCTVSGATEAGIYVGQSIVARVKQNLVSDNTVGIDIENSRSIDVEGNTAKKNSIGIVVSSRPFLIVSSTKDVNIFSNIVTSNNRSNNNMGKAFVSKLGKGVGVQLVAAHNVALQSNTIFNHAVADIALRSFEGLGEHYQSDPMFIPFITGAAINDVAENPISILVQNRIAKPDNKNFDKNILCSDSNLVAQVSGGDHQTFILSKCGN